MNRIVFTNRQTCLPERTETSEKLGIIGSDGTGLLTIDFAKYRVPGAIIWHKGPVFPDGRRMIVHSHEFLKRISPETPFYQTVKVRVWIYDFRTEALTPIEVYGTHRSTYVSSIGPLPGGDRLVAGLFTDGDARLVTMDLDGSDQLDITKPGEGFAHGPSGSPDGRQLATEFSVQGEGTRITVMGIDGGNRVRFPGETGHYHFVPTWSPDGQWILYVDYQHDIDPEHHQADLCLARPDGTEQRFITEGRPFWLSAVYGGPETYGGGSNMPQWLPDGSRVTFVRLIPGSRTAWPLSARPEYDDHWGREFRPERACGGTEICLLDPFTGRCTQLTRSAPPVWDFRPTCSAGGKQIAFCRAGLGSPSALWVMDAQGGHERFLTAGHAGKGADHPVWIPQ